MGKELEIAKQINKEITETLFPDNPDRPLVSEVFNKHNPNMRMENNNQVYFEEHEFYEVFENICNNNIKDVDENKVLENLKIPSYNFDYLPNSILDLLVENKYFATKEIIERELYLSYYKNILLDLDKDEQINKIVNELGKLLKRG